MFQQHFNLYKYINDKLKYKDSTTSYNILEMNHQINVDQIRNIIQGNGHQSTKDFIYKLMKQLKYVNNEQPQFMKDIFSSIETILKDPNEHPLIKLKSHKLIMYLILMGDPQVYDAFQTHLLPIFRGNCLYNKNMAYNLKGEDFFKKTKFYSDSNLSNTQKNQIKKYGIDFIIFSLETVFNLAKWLPYDIEDQTSPSKFAATYQNMIKQRIMFPPSEDFKFFSSQNVEAIQQNIKQIQRQIYSTLYSEKNTSSFADLQIQSQNKNQSIQKITVAINGIGSLPLASNTPIKHQISSSKYMGVQEEKKKLQNQIETQRKYFEEELFRQKSSHQQNIYKYQKKISNLEDQMQAMRQKMTIVESRQNIKMMDQLSDRPQSVNNSQQSKDKIISNLQKLNETLSAKVKTLQEALKSPSQSRYESVSNSRQNSQISKLKKQNITLKTKLLTECEQKTEFENSKNRKNLKETPDALKFIGFEDSRSCFEPFYSNSSSEIKVRLRKAILRDKELLYKDKILEVGCMTKLESLNTVRLTVVFTNISEQPLFNFLCQFVTREDLTVKILSNCRNYLEISGQTKSQIHVSVNQIDFRCLLSAIRFTIDSAEQKMALIMPISKLKLAQSLVYTPIQTMEMQPNTKSGKNPFLAVLSHGPNGNKAEKIFKSDRKMLPTLNKFKDYFPNSLLQKDITGHQTYVMKIQFMGSKFYLEIDQVGSQTRIAVLYSVGKIAQAQKLLDQLVFVFSKHS